MEYYQQHFKRNENPYQNYTNNKFKWLARSFIINQRTKQIPTNTHTQRERERERDKSSSSRIIDKKLKKVFFYSMRARLLSTTTLPQSVWCRHLKRLTLYPFKRNEIKRATSQQEAIKLSITKQNFLFHWRLFFKRNYKEEY